MTASKSKMSSGGRRMSVQPHKAATHAATEVVLRRQPVADRCKKSNAPGAGLCFGCGRMRGVKGRGAIAAGLLFADCRR
jgi:hypothetical protein